MAMMTAVAMTAVTMSTVVTTKLLLLPLLLLVLLLLILLLLQLVRLVYLLLPPLQQRQPRRRQEIHFLCIRGSVSAAKTALTVRVTAAIIATQLCRSRFVSV